MVVDMRRCILDVSVGAGGCEVRLESLGCMGALNLLVRCLCGCFDYAVR